MICDLHVHAVGTGPVSPASASWLLRFIAQRAGVSLRQMDSASGRAALSQRMLRMLDESEVDQAVFLALDHPHDELGNRIDRPGVLPVSNDEAAALADRTAKGRFGASIHPYRHDAISELERAAEAGACLVKWLPSVQNICPDAPSCFPFYEALAHLRVPLLTHTGNEHTFPSFNQSFNAPHRLEPALRMGVKVIAAHCGTRLFLHERCHFSTWAAMASEYEHLYGDLSAFCVPTRAGHLRHILRNRALVEKVVYGSDFPVPALPLGHLLHLGLSKARELRRIKNPFNRPVAMLRALGVPDRVFTRGSMLLANKEGVPC